MPWPLSSSKSRSRPASSQLDTAAFALDDTANDSRRSASVDLSRSGSVSPLTALQADSKRDRRSSFPRLALPSWRTGRPSGEHDEEDGAVELVAGHATPFSANGLRGGFAPDDLGSSRSSSIRSGSIRSTYYNGDDQEDEEGGSLRTGGSSRTRVMVSPFLTPVDSGFSDFGPDSIVPEELDRPRSIRAKTSSARMDASSKAGDEAKEEAVPAATKRRTRGWFSFSSSANGGSTPTAEEPKMLGVDPLSVTRTTVTHPAGQPSGTDGPEQTRSETAKAATPTKSKFVFPSRRRGNSELSMKNVGD